MKILYTPHRYKTHMDIWLVHARLNLMTFHLGLTAQGLSGIVFTQYTLRSRNTLALLRNFRLSYCSTCEVILTGSVGFFRILVWYPISWLSPCFSTLVGYKKHSQVLSVNIHCSLCLFVCLEQKTHTLVF